MNLAREKIFRAAALSISGIGSQRLRQIIAWYGSAEEAWKASEKTFRGSSSWIRIFLKGRKAVDPADVEQRLLKEKISLVIPGEDNYPFLLSQCPDAPPLLFYKGRLEPGQEALAIVGARKATAYGKAVASFLARELVQNNFIVVSGLARGIDTAAHQGALEGNGVTWAFMAGGLDKIYPPENKNIAEKIMERGALLSEYPPGIVSEPGNFPARNRLISGSARGVVVVEAAEKSGSLITVDFALEQGRDVFAVPGPIFSEMSKGTHQLLRMGAKLVENVQDIISELGVSPVRQVDGKIGRDFADMEITGESAGDSLFEEGDGTYGEILKHLSDIPLHIDRLAVLCSLSPQEIALGLLELELQGKIKQLPGKFYVLERIKQITG